MFSSLTAPQALSPYQKYLKTPKLDAQIQDLSEDLSLSEGLSLSLSLRNFYGPNLGHFYLDITGMNWTSKPELECRNPVQVWLVDI